MKKFVLSASILSADFYKLGKEVQEVLSYGVDWIHFDVMDSHYVSALTMGPMILQSLRKNDIKVPVDVHLMVLNSVDELIIQFSKVGANYIIIHPETTHHLYKTLELIQFHGCKSGIALNPATSLNVLDYVLEKVDLILIMSVNPGSGGQIFLNSSLSKISQVRKLIDKSGKDILLSVDGGINLKNADSILRSGADILVVGSEIFLSKNYFKVISSFKNLFLNI